MKILVTGGASGLGESITKVCAGDSSNDVHFTYHRSAKNAAALEAAYPNVRAIPCDFRSSADIDRLRKRIPEIDIDVLVNNAHVGPFIGTHFHKTDPRAFLDQFADNVLATVNVTQAAIDCFRRKKQGKVITILSSFLIGAPPIGAGIYAANKAYLAQLSKVWATENSRFNITSNTVSPSFMLTPTTSGVDPRIVEQMREAHPLKRLLTTTEAAAAVMFLCTASPHINGIDIPLNAAERMP